MRCLLAPRPLSGLYLGLGFLLDPPSSGRPEQWPLLLLLAVTMAWPASALPRI